MAELNENDSERTFIISQCLLKMCASWKQSIVFLSSLPVCIWNGKLHILDILFGC